MYVLVMFSSRLKFPEKDVRVAEVTVSPPFSSFVTELACYIQALEKVK